MYTKRLEKEAFTFQCGITCKLQPLDYIPGNFVLSPFFLQPIVVILQYPGVMITYIVLGKMHLYVFLYIYIACWLESVYVEPKLVSWMVCGSMQVTT